MAKSISFLLLSIATIMIIEMTSIITAKDFEHLETLREFPLAIEIRSASHSHARGFDKRIKIAERAPFIVAIYKRRKHICNGAIVTKDFIITTAYCCQKIRRKTAHIKIGSTNLQNVYEVSIDKITINPLYNKLQHYFDTCEIKLKESLLWSDHVAPVKIPTRPLPDSVAAYIYTWKYSYNNNNNKTINHNLLKRIKIYHVDTKACQDRYFQHQKFIHMFCGADLVVDDYTDRHLCGINYGSPLIYHGYLYGLASWSLECKKFSYQPFVFTDTHIYRNSSLTGLQAF